MQSTMYVRSSTRRYRNAKPGEILEAAANVEITRVERDAVKLNGPREAMRFFVRLLGHLNYECFSVVFMNGGFETLGVERMFRGTIDHTMIHVREVVREALDRNAAIVMVAHNHPTGEAIPSKPDMVTTVRLVNALAHFDIRLLDHVVVAGEEAFSFGLHGVLPEPSIE